jgi:hypothetical protein
MSILYNKLEDLDTTAVIKTLPNGRINLLFLNDSGKFRTYEVLDEFEFTAGELLEILQKNDNR